jgi:hypothetical protein
MRVTSGVELNYLDYNTYCRLLREEHRGAWWLLITHENNVCTADLPFHRLCRCLTFRGKARASLGWK